MKAAVNHFSTCLASGFGRKGIRVNGMGVDLTQTPQVNYISGYEDADHLWEAWAPVGRLGWPEDQARVALFLASDLSAFVTGHNIPVDGGSHAGGGWFFSLGVMDFAGGIVVHITAGVAALVACIMVGKRKGYPDTQMIPHNLTYTVIGSAMLWVGWFGFNAGSALAANGNAAMALLVTHLSAATATLTWMLIEWKANGKPSVLGIATGAVGGLVAITPAAGFVGPAGALAIGVGTAPESLLAPAAVAASCAFMLPVATAPNAIIYASGEVSIAEMMKRGLRVNLIGIVIISAIGYWLAPLFL